MSEIKYEGTALLDEDGEPVFGRQRNIRQATGQLLGVDIFHENFFSIFSTLKIVLKLFLDFFRPLF